MVGVRWGGWAQESDAWVPACLPLVPGSPGLPEPLVLRLEKGSVSQGRSISVANAHQHQPTGIKTATGKLTLRHDVAETPLLPPLPPIASCSALLCPGKQLGLLVALGPRWQPGSFQGLHQPGRSHLPAPRGPDVPQNQTWGECPGVLSEGGRPGPCDGVRVPSGGRG